MLIEPGFVEWQKYIQMWSSPSPLSLMRLLSVAERTKNRRWFFVIYACRACVFPSLLKMYHLFEEKYLIHTQGRRYEIKFHRNVGKYLTDYTVTVVLTATLWGRIEICYEYGRRGECDVFLWCFTLHVDEIRKARVSTQDDRSPSHLCLSGCKLLRVNCPDRTFGSGWGGGGG